MNEHEYKRFMTRNNENVNDNYVQYGRNVDHNGITFDLAVTYCYELEKNNKKVPHWAISWWEEFQQYEAKRRKDSDRDMDMREARENAMNKLTKEERKLLALRNREEEKEEERRREEYWKNLSNYGKHLQT